MKKLIVLGSVLLTVAVSSVSLAAPVMIGGVPDWNQPTLPDATLPDPGPVNNVNSPAAGPTAAWCVPTASANIMGYYRDTMPALTIGDGLAFPNTTARAPNAADWRDDAVDDQTVAGPRQDLGWYLNTNNIGDPLAPVVQPMAGTNYANILPGLGNYFAAHGLGPTIINFAASPGPVAGLDTSGVLPPHTVPMSYARIRTEIDNGRPVLLHLSYWNVLPPNSVRQGPILELPDYDWGIWGAKPGVGPGGEGYETGDVGHTVTVVGYWNGADGNNPYVGMGNGGTNPDALIIHNDSDGTLGAVPNATPLPVVIPYSVGEQVAGLNVPWVMQTEISSVPEPSTLTLTALSLLGMGWRRRKRT